MPKYKHTKVFTSKLCALLYYVHMKMYIRINCNFPRVIIFHLYILVRFHTQRLFRTSLSVRVSDPGHPVVYSRQFFTNKPGHKIYLCMLVRSKQHNTLLHNPTILHTKTCFVLDSHIHQKISSKTKLSHSSLIHQSSPHTSLSASKKIQTKIQVKTFLFFRL